MEDKEKVEMVKKTIWMPKDCRTAFIEMANQVGVHERYLLEDMMAVYFELMEKHECGFTLSYKPKRQYAIE